MALTNKQRQSALREKRGALGQKEMRGVWVTNEEEAVLKPKIREELRTMRKAT